MKKNWLIVLSCVLLLACMIVWNRTMTSAWYAEKNVLTLEEENPTSWVFDESFQIVKEAIWSCLGMNKYRGFAVSGFGYDFDKNAREENYYKTPYFRVWNINKVPSYVYRKDNKGLPVKIEIAIYLDFLEQGKTRVLVDVLRYEVQTGHGIRIDSHPFPFPYRGEINKLLSPSTIEPYEILYKIGKELELSEKMPKIKYPAKLTPKEIEDTYYNYNTNNKINWDSWDGDYY